MLELQGEFCLIKLVMTSSCVVNSVLGNVKKKKQKHVLLSNNWI